MKQDTKIDIKPNKTIQVEYYAITSFYEIKAKVTNIDTSVFKEGQAVYINNENNALKVLK